MESASKTRPGCVYFASLSLAASVLGVILTAILYALAWNPVAGPFDFRAFTVMFVAFFALFVALPVGLALGIPLLLLSAPLLRRFLVIGTLVFTVIGLIAGLALQELWGNGQGLAVPDDAAIFGAVIGGLHPLMFGLAEPLARRRLVAAFLLSAVVPAAFYAYRDDDNVRANPAEHRADVDFLPGRGFDERPTLAGPQG